MKVKLLLMVLVVGCLFLFSGCANMGGMHVSTNQTTVELSEPNYSIVHTNVKGQASAAYILGISMSIGAYTDTLAVYRVEGTGMLYEEAMENLWNNYEKAHGKVEGKKLALVNVRYDSEAWNFLLYTKVRVYIRADMVEFK